MKLYLMQHGDAVSKELDPERPLSEAGRKDVERIGSFLSKTSFQPKRIFHSGKTRALQTAKIVANRAVPTVVMEALSGIGPKDAVEPIAKKARDWSDDVLLVGHLPFMARLVSLLVKSKADDAVAYQPGSIVCVERDEDGDWRVAWMIRPELLVA